MPVLVIDKLKQKNDGKFFLVDAKDVEVNGLPLTNYLTYPLTQEQYDQLSEEEKHNGVTYVIIKED